MILSVPTTWEESYLVRLKKYLEVGWLYGSFPTEIVGSGRQAALLPAVDREKASRSRTKRRPSAAPISSSRR